MGLTGSCGGGAEPDNRPYELSVNGGVLATRLDFFGGEQGRLDEVSALATFSDQLGGLALQLGAGAILGGSLNGEAGSYRLDPGPEIVASLGKTFFDGGPGRPYLAGSFSVGGSTVSATNESQPTDRPRLTAFDLRLSAVIGKQLFGFWLPYAGASIFGGLAFFDPAGASFVGTDLYHFRISLGSAFDLPGHLRLFVEAGGPELSAVAGLGYRF